MSTPLVVLEYIKVFIWPLTVLALAVGFRARISALLTRMTRLEALGASAEFEQAVAQAGTEDAAPQTARTSGLTWVDVRSYQDARAIGELLRQHGTVGVNLEALDDADAKRIVDFMAGLVFHASGQIERLTSRRFLVSDAN
ncbi:cell division protein SepF [Cellulomonas sp. APG4]|uniref:cell division protein SepF n=1 Tax=Cellulomonas sp. APG4 TaxID=1538656 RepID=UPI00137A7CE2|nr:cell division protein SepF [Cellulomonas sp. APG4]NCT91937.1 cell division protein SepF [Cellulomonas sp. APG4]